MLSINFGSIVRCRWKNLEKQLHIIYVFPLLRPAVNKYGLQQNPLQDVQ